MEQRVELLLQQMQGMLAMFRDAVQELQQVRAEMGGGQSNAADCSRTLDGNPFDLLHGGFQPRSIRGPWGYTSSPGCYGTRLPCLLVQGKNPTAQQQGSQLNAAAAGTNSVQPTVQVDGAGTAAVSFSEALLETQVLDADTLLPEAQLQDDAVEQPAGAAHASATPASGAAAAGPSNSRLQQQQQQQQQPQQPTGMSCSSLSDTASHDVADTESSDSRHVQTPASRAGDADASNSSSLGATAALNDDDNNDDAAASEQQEELEELTGPALVEVAEDGEAHTCMLRVACAGRPHGRRTLATYINDEVGLTDEDGRLAANSYIPYELHRPDPHLASHLYDAMSWVLAHLSHDRRQQGWMHQQDELEEQQDEEEGEELLDEPLQEMMELEQQQRLGQLDEVMSEQQLEHQQQQKQQQHEEEDMGAAVSPAAARGVAVSPHRRKQAKPVRKPHAAADRALDISSDAEDEQPPPRTNISALAELLQRLPAQPAVGGVHHIGAAAVAGGGTSLSFAGMANAEQLAEMQMLVQQDVERLQQQWRQEQLPTLQQCAAEIWHEQHAQQTYWQQVADERRAKLDKGVHELVVANADNIAKYKRERHTLCEAIHEWVSLLEGASYVLSVVQLPEPPAAVEPGDTAAAAAAAAAIGEHAAADKAGQAMRKPNRRRSKTDSGGQPEGDEASDESDMADFIDDSDDDTQKQQAVDPTAAADQATASSSQNEGAVASTSQGDISSDAAGSEEPKAGAWNVPHIAPGATQMLQPGRRLRRLQRQAELAATQQQAERQQLQQQQQQDDTAVVAELEPAAAADADGTAAPAAKFPAASPSPEARNGEPVSATGDAAVADDYAPELEDDIQVGKVLSTLQSPEQGSQQQYQQQQDGSPTSDEFVGMSDMELERQLEAATDGEKMQPPDEDAEELPVGNYTYSGLVAKDSLQQRGCLQRLQPCEVLSDSSGGGAVSFWLLDLQLYSCQLPRWHTWEEACGVAGLSQSVGVVRVLPQSGPIQQVLLANVRPTPPVHLASIIPATMLHEQHHGHNSSGRTSPSTAAAAWASSDAGLLHLSKALRPGTLVEYRARNHSPTTWVPALVLHSNIMRPQLSSQIMKEILLRSKPTHEQAGCTCPCCEQQEQQQLGQQQQQQPGEHAKDACERITLAGLTAAGEWLREGGGQHTPHYQAPQPDDCVLVLQLLGATCDVRHVKWHMLCGASPSVRYMLHWQPDREDDEEEQSDTPDAIDSPQNSGEMPTQPAGAVKAGDLAVQITGAPASTANAETVAQGTWRRLTCLRFHWLSRSVREQLVLEQKAWLKPLGWPQRGRRRRSTRPNGCTLADTAVAAIAKKLARRPTAAALPPSLVVAAGYGPGSKRQQWHKIAARKQRLTPGRASEEGAAGAGRKGSRPQRAAQGEGRAAQQPKRRSRRVLTDGSESDGEAQHAAKRICSRPGLRPRRGSASSLHQGLAAAADSSDAEDDMEVDAGTQGRPRRAAAAVAAAGDQAARRRSSSAGGSEVQLPSDLTEEEEPTSEGYDDELQPDAAGGVLLFDDQPERPLNPMLPRCWFTPDLPADKQVLKQHQLEGLRFMWNCLVTEHADSPEHAAAGDGPETQGDRRSVAAEPESDADDDFIETAAGKHGKGRKKNKNKRKRGRGAKAISIDAAGGCILAHSMGLGKSFQTIALLWLFFQKLEGRALLVVPTNVVRNWADEFKKWLPGSREPEANGSLLRKNKVHMAENKQQLVKVVPQWRDADGTVLIISYGVFNNAVKETDSAAAGGAPPPAAAAAAAAAAVRLARVSPGGSALSSRPSSVDNSMDDAQDQDMVDAAEADEELEPLQPLRRKSATEMREDVRNALLNDASIIVADEAHQMKNAKALACRTMNMLNSRRRLALTGYPLQNNMEEYYQMIAWVQPEDVFMTAADFKSQFTDPITAGQRADANRSQRNKMAKQLSVLQDRTAHFIQRAGPEILVRDLPAKLEYVLALAPKSTQWTLLETLIGILGSRGRSLFRDMELMRKILCTRDHGYSVLSKAVAQAQAGKRVALETGEDDMQLIIESQQPAGAGPSGLGPLRQDSLLEPEIMMSQEGDVLQEAAPAATQRKRGRPPSTGKGKNSNQQGEKLPVEIIEELLQAYPEEIVRQHQEQQGHGSSSGGSSNGGGGGGSSDLLPKEAFIRHLVASCCEGERQEKVVVFSQSIPVLTALASMLESEFGYRAGREYLRLQGEVGAAKRSELIARFNRQGSSSKVFLISTRAGAVGINLVAARRLVLYDIPWNPVHNKQAVSRIWRYGQSRNCYLYHLMYSGTIEQYLYERTLKKLELFARVVERQHKRRATLNACEEEDLYALKQDMPLSSEQLAAAVEAKLPINSAADSTLRSLLQQSATVESLKLVRLENHEEQLQEDPAAKLTKEEKLRAAIEYERERRRYQSVPSGAAAGNGASARAARAERRWRQQLITQYGNDFEQQLEQEEQQARLQQQQEQAQRQAEALAREQQQQQQLEQQRQMQQRLQQLRAAEIERVRQQQLQHQQADQQRATQIVQQRMQALQQAQQVQQQGLQQQQQQGLQQQQQQGLQQQQQVLQQQVQLQQQQVLQQQVQLQRAQQQRAQQQQQQQAQRQQQAQQQQQQARQQQQVQVQQRPPPATLQVLQQMHQLQQQQQLTSNQPYQALLLQRQQQQQQQARLQQLQMQQAAQTGGGHVALAVPGMPQQMLQHINILQAQQQQAQQLNPRQAAQPAQPVQASGVPAANNNSRVQGVPVAGSGVAAALLGSDVEPPAKRFRADGSVPGFFGGSPITQQRQQGLFNSTAVRQGSQIPGAPAAAQQAQPAAAQQQAATAAAPPRAAPALTVTGAPHPGTAGMPPPQTAATGPQPQAAAAAPAQTQTQMQAAPSPAAAAAAAAARTPPARAVAAQAAAAIQQQRVSEVKEQSASNRSAGGDHDECIDLTQDDW